MLGLQKVLESELGSLLPGWNARLLRVAPGLIPVSLGGLSGQLWGTLSARLSQTAFLLLIPEWCPFLSIPSHLIRVNTCFPLVPAGEPFCVFNDSFAHRGLYP